MPVQKCEVGPFLALSGAKILKSQRCHLKGNQRTGRFCGASDGLGTYYCCQKGLRSSAEISVAVNPMSDKFSLSRLANWLRMLARSCQTNIVWVIVARRPCFFVAVPAVKGLVSVHLKVFVVMDLSFPD